MTIDLPRLIALLGYIIAVTGFIPLYPHLPLMPRLLFLAGLAAGLASGRRGRPLVPGILLTVTSILFFLWYGAQFSRHNPALPVVSILVVLLAARLAAEKNPRTWLQTCALALFALSSSSLFDLGLQFLLLLSLMLPLLALMLVLLTFQSCGVTSRLSGQAIRQAIIVGLLIPVCSLLLTPLFFPVLPRTQLPLWNFIQQIGGTSPSGLADTVAPGDTTTVPDSGLLAFRAEMERLAPSELYWRGTVFSRLDELRWQRDSGTPGVKPQATGKRISQTITMEPGSTRSLIGLDLPVSFNHPNGSSIPNATWNRPLPSSRRFRYEVSSLASGTAGTALPAPHRELLTSLPDDTPSRLRQLAAQLKQQGTSDRQRLEATEAWFRASRFNYSRTGLPTGPDALERFLFETRSGHCEFYASGYALLLRGMQIPARLVGGYLGGIYNELGGYYRITEDRAHVWVEVWLEREGWVRIDPSSFAVNAESALGAQRQVTFTQQFRLLLDTLDHTWNSAVITYDFERQLKIASKASSHLQTFTLKNAGRLVLPVSTGACAVLATWWYLRYRRNGYLSRESRLLRRFHAAIQREFGITPTPVIGLFDLARQTGNSKVGRFAAIYGGAVYRGRRLNAEELQQLKEILRQGFGNIRRDP